MALEPGSRLDAYEIVRPLGSGGMGEVWLARDLNLERQVALKLLPADLTQVASRVARFRQEARAASALNHPNVCTIYAVGETPDGQHYIAMEYVEGETLRQPLAGPPLMWRQVLDIAVQVASALTAAHAAGIVHRDLKPENVMLRPDALVKVLDFGLAKLTSPQDAAGQSTLTAFRTNAGRMVGTVDYMSPEQARGQIVDARTDVWSLGVLLYEIVAGRGPFEGQSTSDVLAAILAHEPVPLLRFTPDVPAEFQRIVGKALRKDREQRYQHMKDLLLDLQALHNELAVHAWSSHAAPPMPSPVIPPTAIVVPAGVTPRPRSGTESVVIRLTTHRRTATLVAGVVAVIVGGMWWTVRHRPTNEHGVRIAPIQRTLTRLTFGSGLQTDVTWSPDGRFIAYASDRTGNFDIWVQAVGGGDPVQVTRSVAQDTQPDWSPDGSTLVFRSERDGGGLFLVPALGGVERQLTSFGSHASWSPDNSEILFVDETRFGSAEAPVRLFVVSPEEGAPREILADFLRGGSWSWIALHPSGRISVMGTHRQLGRGFFTIARDGTRFVHSNESPDFPLRAFTGGDFVSRRFRWHASGTALYVQTESSGVYNLWRVRVEPNTLRWMSAERLTTGAGPDVAAALSRDGTRLAFTTEHGSARLWVFPLDRLARRLGSGKPLTEDDARAVSFALSPDGQFVAYTLKHPGSERPEVWIANIVDGTTKPVATSAIDPTWSPDGKAIAYTYLRLDKQPVIGRTAVQQLGGKERFLSRWSRDLFLDFDWSAERGLVGSYVTSRPEDASLALWPTTNPDADKPDRVLISQPKVGFWQAQFSPNGRWLSFVALRNERPSAHRFEIVVAPADGSRPEHWIRIAADHIWPDKPRWAPDGRSLYFISRRPASYFNLWAIRFDPERGTPAGQPFALTKFDSPSLVISPDMPQSDMDVSSRHAVLTMTTVTGNIWMLDNVDK